MRQAMRKLGLHRRSHSDLEDLARLVNPFTRGWINYYGSYCRSALYPVFKHLDRTLGRWATRKFKRFRGRFGKAMQWLRGIRQRQPALFAHWRMMSATAG